MLRYHRGVLQSKTVAYGKKRGEGRGEHRVARLIAAMLWGDLQSKRSSGSVRGSGLKN